MQQIYLTGRYANDIAARALTALRVRAAGYRLLPFAVEGGVRGLSLHLLTVPDAPLHNDVPCEVYISPGERIVIGEAFERIAAPALRQAAAVQTPVLIGGVSKAALEEPAFQEAVCACLCGRALAVVIADNDAVEPLRAMTPAEDQLWLHAETDDEALLGQLLQELAMRV